MVLCIVLTSRLFIVDCACGNQEQYDEQERGCLQPQHGRFCLQVVQLRNAVPKWGCHQLISSGTSCRRCALLFSGLPKWAAAGLRRRVNPCTLAGLPPPCCCTLEPTRSLTYGYRDYAFQYRLHMHASSWSMELLRSHVPQAHRTCSTRCNFCSPAGHKRPLESGIFTQPAETYILCKCFSLAIS